MGKMNAITISNYGGPEVMELARIDTPEPQSGQVLVQIKYASVIPLDFKIRNGWLKDVFPSSFPYTPGASMAGEIIAVASNVTEFQLGDRVFGNVKGSYAEYALAEASQLVKMPDILSFEEAATIKGGAESAWKALFTEGNLEKDQTVLIYSCRSWWCWPVCCSIG
ncbi:NADP-dependent oxidoreductase [Alkalicoccobacillus murimartini]|uniref:NADPH:quinone reductase-like Zn-dependent oxidoreductase n=1 Tax=Alkalicoccobacillus murimartini TaxID=171685 RepID=A0ABT9YLX7_9BACI|nr:NADP-dependent oxidoreductase [Alkalicoccobacillus murimartini]MDQ0208644.1 NADPH:quinone reductase-like Zn-dependent oxidoreductase [Alkalicoccobacillus murimartini]